MLLSNFLKERNTAEVMDTNLKNMRRRRARRVRDTAPQIKTARDRLSS